MSTLATDKLAELVRKKHQVLTQLREIGLRQQALVDQSDITHLLQLLGAKQHLIGALQTVERSLRPFQSDDPESRAWRSPADRAACAERANDCRRLLDEVMQLEREQEARMIERRDQVADRLHRAGTAHRAVGAYEQQARQNGWSIQDGDPATTERLDLTTGGS